MFQSRELKPYFGRACPPSLFAFFVARVFAARTAEPHLLQLVRGLLLVLGGAVVLTFALAAL